MRMLPTKPANTVLSIIAVLLVAAFFRFGESQTQHTHELYHYLIGGKYFRSLGYQGLYSASALSLIEQGLVSKQVRLRDLKTKKTLIGYAQWAEQGQMMKSRMGPRVWQEFSTDLAFFDSIIREETSERHFSDEGWENFFIDHGFNPSPLWVMLASPLLQYGSIADIYPLVTLPDYLLLGGALIALLALVAKPYRLPLLIVFGLAINLFWGSKLHIYNWTGGSILRYSWFFFLTIGLTKLSRGKYTTSGILLTMSAVERLFPFAFLGGAWLAIAVYVCRRPSTIRECIQGPLGRFSVAAGGTLVAISLLIVALYPLGHLVEFKDNMSVHEKLYAPNNMGYKKLLSYSVDMERYQNWHVVGEEESAQKFSDSVVVKSFWPRFYGHSSTTFLPHWAPVHGYEYAA